MLSNAKNRSKSLRVLGAIRYKAEGFLGIDRTVTAINLTVSKLYLLRSRDTSSNIRP